MVNDEKSKSHLTFKSQSSLLFKWQMFKRAKSKIAPASKVPMEESRMRNFLNSSSQDVSAVKRLSHAEREALKAEINSYDPSYIFDVAKESRNPDKRYIICPNCGNGTGSDKTPVEVNRVGNVWLYHCFKCDSFTGDLLKIIATENNLNLHDGEDMCKALAVGADDLSRAVEEYHKAAV